MYSSAIAYLKIGLVYLKKNPTKLQKQTNHQQQLFSSQNDLNLKTREKTEETNQQQRLAYEE